MLIDAGDRPNVIADGEDGHYIVQMWDNDNGHSRMEANARLIAQAPAKSLTMQRSYGKRGDKANESI